MKVESVEWSIGKSPDSMTEIWSVAATMEAIILILAMDNPKDVAAVLAKTRDAGAASQGEPPPADAPPKTRKRSRSK